MVRMAKNRKNETTLTFWTKKVGKVKVVLFFCFGHFLMENSKCAILEMFDAKITCQINIFFDGTPKGGVAF